ncbi:MAG: tocopherol cyclase family protein, partial [Myxococcota bacterium]|nr:tocopherol cyclase family protein [Myxococcota bacterium]
VRGAVRREAPNSPPVQRIRWDLRHTTTSEPLHLLPLERMYDLPLPKSKLLTPYPSERFDGAIEFGGERWDVAGWPGMQGHNWGRQHAEHYAWVHCNRFEGAPDAVFEGFSARVKLGPVTTPFISAAVVRAGGATYDFRGPRALFSRAVRVTPTSWSFSAGCGDRAIRVSASCRPEEMAGLHYPNPDGEMTYCLNTKIGDLDVTIRDRSGVVLALECRGAGALEVATKDPGHGIDMLL